MRQAPATVYGAGEGHTQHQHTAAHVGKK